LAVFVFDRVFDSQHFAEAKKTARNGRLKGSSFSFSANERIIPSVNRAVKSTLTMLVIGDNSALQ
jgi:hypothetical protein